MTVETDRLTYFRLRLRFMEDLSLITTEKAMRLGYDDATTSESRAFYDDRLHAVRDELRQRSLALAADPPEPHYAQCHGCGGGVTLEPTSNGGYTERCARCHATLFFHNPERSAS